jgi:hypothetical protein
MNYVMLATLIVDTNNAWWFKHSWSCSASSTQQAVGMPSRLVGSGDAAALLALASAASHAQPVISHVGCMLGDQDPCMDAGCEWRGC